MKTLYPLLAVVLLIWVVLAGASEVDLRFFLGVVVPYVAIALFIFGFVYRVLKWAHSPVPFRITTTCGQQKSLPWIKSSNLESPHDVFGVIGRMALEVLLFRSLFRSTRAELRGRRLVFSEQKYLWAAGLAFHWSMLVIFLRHYRFFTEPVPVFVTFLQSVDGFLKVGVPEVYVSSVTVLLALTYLLIRRLAIPAVRYISLPSDYFPLFLLLGIAGSGFLMRHVYRVDVERVKELMIGLITFHPVVPSDIGAIFYVHFFLVSVLAVYFPFSKLMHLGGIFLSPTRNLANNSRARRHVNPWNRPLPVHTYAEWQEEFKDKLVAAGIPLDSDSEHLEERADGQPREHQDILA